jgi:putative adhesin
MTRQLERISVPGPATPPKGPWVTPIRVLAAIIGLSVLVVGTVSVIGFFMVRHRTERAAFTDPITRVQVISGTGDVRIRTAAAQQPSSVISRTSESFRTAEHSETLSNGLLRVEGGCRGAMVISDFCAVDFEIFVPAGTVVSVDTGTGDVSVHGTGAAVDVTTGSGDIRLARTGGASQAKTGTGDVTGALLAGGTISVRTGSGDIDLAYATAPDQVKAKAGTGDIDVLVPRDGSAYRISTETGTGDRKVNVPTAPDSKRTISLDTGSGDIRVGSK